MNNFEILCKWGCDGSSSQARYKQITSSNFNDSDIFMFSLVPLQLRCTKINNPKTILLWKNPRPSSTRYCRPIKFEYKKETIESTLEEVNAVEEEIKSLIPTLVFKNNIEIRVKSTLMFTMVDEKICNTMTGSSSQKCYICKCSPKDMNDITRAKNLSVQPEHLKFGLSTLHAYIRFFECLIHISYRLEFKKWQVRTSDDKVIFEKRKKYIQDRFRTETGLLIDVVLQGKGTTNDGNTTRRFFKNAELTSAITNVDLQLIKRFGVILKTMSSGYEINLEKFEAYTLETAELYVSLYPWYYMPASVHKILIHGTDVIRSALLPIGQLSEEAQEARNKDFRNY